MFWNMPVSKFPSVQADSGTNPGLRTDGTPCTMITITFILQTFGSWLKDEERLPSPTSRASSNGTVVFDEIRPEDSEWFQCFVMYDGEEYTSIAYFLRFEICSTRVRFFYLSHQKCEFNLNLSSQMSLFKIYLLLQGGTSGCTICFVTSN